MRIRIEIAIPEKILYVNAIKIHAQWKTVAEFGLPRTIGQRKIK